MPEAKTLREWRKEKGYTTKFIAEKIGISTYSLNAKERGKTDFTKFQQKQLCDLYGITGEQIKKI